MIMDPGPEQDKPTDLSIKSKVNVGSNPGTTTRKVKYIPPPLDLNAHTLEPDGLPPGGLQVGPQGVGSPGGSAPPLIHGIAAGVAAADVRVPKSPNELPRESLPLRKRHLVEASRHSAFHSKSPKSAGLDGSNFRLTTPVDLSAAGVSAATTINGRHTAPNSPLVVSNSSLTLTPSSATSSTQAFTHFPVPPPLIPVPQGSGNAVAAVAMAAMANAFNNSKANKVATTTSGFPTPPTDVHSPYAWSHSPFAAAAAAAAAASPFSPLPLSPFPVTSLLSPTASHPSSLSSSREDIQSTVEREMLKRRLLPLPPTSAGPFDAPPASPLWSFGGTPVPTPVSTPVWQCFQVGCRIKFLLPNTAAPWQKAEELAWKDHVAMKVDARNSYQYAPNGLILLQADESSEAASTEVILRFSPAQLSGAPDILVEAPISHPFLVKDKGWCSLSPGTTSAQFCVRCQDLVVGDICLPPNHPEAIRTPDLCDRFKRFEFSSPAGGGGAQDDLASPRPLPGERPGERSAFIFGPPPTSIATSALKGNSPPPPSPAKKKEKDCDKPKRPMNGFMLFAKKFRLELIQQHPGKDNRAISVLLGEAWKSLPLEERESYSNKAKVLADEQKKIHPDCWKRKKTVASNNAGPNAGPQVNNNSNSALSSPLPLPAGLANFTLPTSLATPLPLRPPPPLQEVTAQSIKIEAPPTSTLDIV